jgi:hypothetical protein
MKKIFIYIFLAAVLISCKREDFLDRFPPDAINENTFFKNEVDLQLYLNRFYDQLPVERFGLDDNSDDFVPGTPDVLLAGQLIVPSTGGGWDWAQVRQVNYFLSQYHKVNINMALKQKYAAEARFFRALFFWNKVVRFGDVPWFSKYLTETSPELYAPRNTHKEVMDSVLADLNFAETNAALSSESLFQGRITKDVVLALKSRICLWEGTFRKYHGLGDEQIFLRASATASEVLVNSGTYDIYTTGKPGVDYFNLFIQDELKGNKENILARRYINNVVTHNLTREIRNRPWNLSKNFVRSFLCVDGLPTSLSPLYIGDDSLEMEKIGRDSRMSQLIAGRGFVLQNLANGSQDVFTLPRIPYTQSGYGSFKYYSADLVQANQNLSTLDLFIFRYAEILLNYAEAKAELGECDQAVIDKTIKKTRSRVGMPNMVIASLVKDPKSDFSSLPVLLDEIRRERRIELVGEGFRFRDLLRWKAGKAIENPETILGVKVIKSFYPANNSIQGVTLNTDGYIRLYTNITTRIWNDKMYAYPIPTEQFKLNPKLLPQNTGW